MNIASSFRIVFGPKRHDFLIETLYNFTKFKSIRDKIQIIDYWGRRTTTEVLFKRDFLLCA